uniref:Cadherin domain-containing protein n=1 Tax=Wuchereria bancrofti TaxID=6293 RepID=A0A1I8EI72_WUCBA
MVEITTKPEQIFIVNVNIAGNSTPSFSSDIYNVTLGNDIVPEMIIPFETDIAMLYVSRRLKPTDDTFQSFYIGALDKQNLIRLAVARIDVNFKQLPISGPKFSNLNYFRQFDKLPPHVTVLRVAANNQFDE